MSGKDRRKGEGSSGGRSIICSDCGSAGVVSTEEDYTFVYGKGEKGVQLSARVPLRTCRDCGSTFLDGDAEDACQEAICRHLGVMTPAEVKSQRKAHGLTQAEFAEITKLGEATISRWERGIVVQNEAYDNYLYLLGLPLNIERIENRERGCAPTRERSGVGEESTFRALERSDDMEERSRRFKLRMSGGAEREAICM